MTLRQSSVLLSRFALFVIYVWFGFLKVIGLSPASAMVEHLFAKTVLPMTGVMHLTFITPNLFVILFGLFEMLIGVLFIIPRAEKWAIGLFFFHIVTTALPLFLLSEVWTKMFVPTLEGQYIIKNLALIACVLTIWSSISSTQITNEHE